MLYLYDKIVLTLIHTLVKAYNVNMARSAECLLLLQLTNIKKQEYMQESAFPKLS